MSFNNPLFFLLFFLFFIIYWMLPRNWQNYFLLAGSYGFSLLWNWHSTVWLGVISLVATGVVFLLDRPIGTKWRLLILSSGLLLSFGALLFFKYFSSVVQAFQALGGKGNFTVASVAIPIGMSFFVFKATSYMIDVYRGKLCRESFLSVCNYIAFFPELAAGPIDRAGTLIPQLKSKRVFNAAYATEAIGQIVWGLFKKVVIADSLSSYVAIVYGSATATGPQLLLATYFFTFQLYCDFSGYSDIAIGCARLLGFSTCRNFAYPFFSRSFGEYWSRWHISLTGWFRDYVYIPLGGRRCSHYRFILNILLVFSLSGIWHGTGYTFVFWGLLNGILLVVFVKMDKTKALRYDTPGCEHMIPRLGDIFSMMLVFHLILVTWIFFRADSIQHGLSILALIIQQPLDLSLSIYIAALSPGLWIPLLIAIEWCVRRYDHPFAIPKMPVSVRWFLCVLLVFVIVGFGKFNNAPFIYFKF